MEAIAGIEIELSLEKKLIEGCIQRLPYEACGILFSSSPDPTPSGKLIVDGYEFIRNTAPQAVSTYAFHPDDWVSAYYRAQKNQRQIVGFFHSHPQGNAAPSIRDEQGSIPWKTYWIVSFTEGKPSLAAYQRTNTQQWFSIPIVRQ